MNFNNVNNDDLIQIYSDSIKEMKSRGIIRTKNVLGDIGEYLAIQYYNKTSGLPTLQTTAVGTQNIDAICCSSKERYSIKSTTTGITGIFYGLQEIGSTIPDKQEFEYVIICEFDKNYELRRILELPWDKFLIHKHWHKRAMAWNLSITKKLVADCKIIYKK